MTNIKKSLIAIFSTLIVLCTLILSFSLSFNATADDVNKKSDIFVLSDEIEKVQDKYAFSPYASNGLVEMSDNGVAVLSTISGSSFRYKYPIRMNNLTEETSLVELYPIQGNDFSIVNAINITLTDTENPLNSFSWRYYRHNNNATYCLVNYMGRNLGLSTESSQAGKYLWENKYGSWGPNLYFVNEKNDFERPFSAYMNYNDMALYCSYGETKRITLDLDDVNCVGKGGIWGGFTNDTAYLSISFELDSAKLGGVIVKSILGFNLDGGFDSVESYDAPNISFELPNEYLEVMPNGAVGVGYPLPEIYANDWFFGECADEDINVTVVDSNGVDCSSLIADGKFFADKTGEYTIKYIASNLMKSNTAEISFKVVDELNPIAIVASSDFGEPEILTQISLPEINVYGGTGILSITETLFYNGQEIAINNSRTLLLDKAGTVSLKVSAKGYSGDEVIRYFTLVIPDSTVLSVENMPKVLQAYTQITFPKAIAYNSFTGEEVDFTITVDGQPLSDDRTYNIPAYNEIPDGKITVVYKASTDTYGENQKTFEIPIVDVTFTPSDIMVPKTGNVTVENTSSGLRLYSQTNYSEVNWAYPVVTGSASVNSFITLGGITENNKVLAKDFDYIDITFTNYSNTTETMFIRAYRACDLGNNLTYLQVNGTGEKYLVDGNMGIPNSFINMYINTSTGYLYDSVKFTPICSIGDYRATVSIIGFRFGKIDGNAGIIVTQISNQSLGSNEYWYDNTAPVVSFAKEMSKNVNVCRGSSFKIPATTAYDMLSDGATVSVTVKAPDGTIVLETDDLLNGASFVAEQVGTYRIVFTAVDIMSNKLPAIYNCYSYDNVTPEITIKNSIQDTLTLGSTIKVPEATAKDNIDETCDLIVYIRNKNNFNVTEVTMGSKYTFTSVGVYEITYLACDSDYNFTELVITVNVVVEEENNV